MIAYYQDQATTIWHGDCRVTLATLGLFSAVVTDPPYGLEFMGEDWDRGVPGMGFWKQIRRNMKPGAYLLAFGGTRTYHRLTCAIEDAGFEIRDCLMWLYGSGFPKSHDVSKAIDKGAGATREVVGPATHIHSRGSNQAFPKRPGETTVEESGRTATQDAPVTTAPATSAAQQWQGWGTALKPAWEPIILARKPLSKKTVAANVLEHGTGGLNVDGCRVPYQGPEDQQAATPASPSEQRYTGRVFNAGKPGKQASTFQQSGQGRWPANLILGCACDGPPHLPICPAGMLDEQSGELKSPKPYIRRSGSASKEVYGEYASRDGGINASFGDSGGASRFFYCPKASRKERGAWNKHPTVKPLALMRWLVRLVTPPGGVILDPFMGSGSTLLAAKAEGFQSVGIDIEAGSCETARRRISASPSGEPIEDAGPGDPANQ